MHVNPHRLSLGSFAVAFPYVALNGLPEMVFSFSWCHFTAFKINLLAMQ